MSISMGERLQEGIGALCSELQNGPLSEDFFLQYKYRDAVKRLSTGITHSYNNIFTGIAGQVSMILRDGDHSTMSSERRDLLSELVQRGVDQTGLFFDFCRIGKEKSKSCSPSRIAERSVSLLNALSRIHHADIKVQPELPNVKARFNEIVLILFYLGENSFEATPEGGMARLEVTLSRDGSEVWFTMVDDGRGFRQEELEQHFLPSVSTKEPGHITGLGLYAAQRVLADHGGRLDIESWEGLGAKVSAILPVSDQVIKQESSEVKPYYPSSETKDDNNRYMILVIDDEESMRNILLDQFQRRGHVAFSVDSCREAVKEFRELSDIISAVLLDVGLQGASGYECIAPLREIRPDIKIILMSGDAADERDPEDTLTYFLKKPFSIEMVERICRL